MTEDVADSLDDLICAWDKMMGADLETLVLLLLGWLGFGGLIFLIAHIIYASLGTGELEKSAPQPVQQKEKPSPPQQQQIKPKQDAVIKPQIKTTPVDLMDHHMNGGSSGQQGAQVVRLSREVPVPKLVPKQRPLSSELSNGVGSVKEETVGKTPVAVGSDPHIVQYINKCWQYIYSSKKARDLIKRVWLHRMNSFTEKSARDDGLMIELLDVMNVPEQKFEFSNMTAEQQASKNIFVTCDLDAVLKLKMKLCRPMKGKLETSHLYLCVNKLRARFSVAVILEEKSLICKLEGWPNLNISIQSQESGPQTEISSEEQNLYDLIEDIVSSAIRGVQTNIKLEDLPGFPVYTPKLSISHSEDNAQCKMLSNKYVRSKTGTAVAANSINGTEEKTRELEVKVVKATQLGGQSANCVEPYVVVEVDEPSQRFQTHAGRGPVNTWDQTFTMNISKQSSEILVEVWDRGQKVGSGADLFLGLGIVSVSELLVTVSQRHVIPLQGRPLEKDQVTGMLTLEFLFKDGGLTFSEAEALPGIHRATELRQTRGMNGTSQLNTIKTYSLQEPTDVISGNDEIAEVAVKELLMNTKEVQPNKSTLLIHSVQKRVATPSSSAQSGGVPDSGNNVTDSVTDATSQTSLDSVNLRRGREKKRNLVSSIKKRISGTTRSLSGGFKLGLESRSSSNSRGESWERGHARSASEHRPCSVGSSGDLSTDTDSGCSISLASFRGDISLSWESDSHLRLPGLQSEDASSLSDVSGISGASHKTYITEESSLVIETLENGMQHHYLIPPQVAKGGRFKKRGTKLHIFLDHIFVARHIKLGTPCCVCSTLIPMRLGKQAYVCRDCGIITHKPCHVKVEIHCPKTSLPTMELYRGSTLVKSRRRRNVRKKPADNTLAPPGSSKHKVRHRLYSIDKSLRRAKNKGESPPTTDPLSATAIAADNIDAPILAGRSTAATSSFDSGGIQLTINEAATSTAESSQASSSAQSASAGASGGAFDDTAEDSPVLSDKLPKNKVRRLQRLRQLSRSSSWKLGRTIFKSTFR